MASSSASDVFSSSASLKPICVVCFDGTTSIDMSLPPPCYANNCDATVCLPCLMKILSSSTLFKAPICPSCGSNMNSKDVKDTILLRRYQLVKTNDKLPDSELGAKELRERQAFAQGSELEQEIKLLVEQRGESAKMSPIKKALSKQDSNGENKTGSTGAMKFPVDESFFKGRMEYSKMTDEEKGYVSNLLTSGDANQLAQAAQILMGISDNYVSDTAALSSSSQPRSGRKRTNTSPPPEKGAMAIRAQAIADKDLKKHHKLEKSKLQHPLPKHMPKCISLSAKGFGDPFNKRVCLLRFKNENPKRRKDIMDNDASEKKKPPRVFVKLARGKADKLNVRKGDVVTHVNGEVFEGTKDDLRSLIQCIRSENDNNNDDVSGEFTMIFNADEATAKALRDRELYALSELP